MAHLPHDPRRERWPGRARRRTPRRGRRTRRSRRPRAGLVFSKDAAVATTMAFLPENASTSKRESISKANMSPFFRSELMRPYSFRKVGRAAIFIQTANLSLSTPTNGEMMSGNVSCRYWYLSGSG